MFRTLLWFRKLHALGDASWIGGGPAAPPRVDLNLHRETRSSAPRTAEPRYTAGILGHLPHAPFPCVRLSGRIDAHLVSDLDATLEGYLNGDQASVTLDLSDVHFLDAAAVRSLVRAGEEYARAGKELRLTPISTQVRVILELSGAGCMAGSAIFRLHSNARVDGTPIYADRNQRTPSLAIVSGTV